ncbi:hypothetical protein [Dyadobacter sp. CY323]|uniref:hypothetical protein n=1 Tax=Dyadobacter sp. CY323 TaxID=2907302 RepID=UPI001F16E674|nr:hypothetical protein [Dyadobacter sp. CY323]MCE6988247.1 hypothetical protein [Dyadobacter sp. CY323]
MNNVKVQMLAAVLLVAGMTQRLSDNKSAKQPFPKRGFWVAETSVHSKTTVVRYYANSNHLVSEKIENGALDISKLSVRKYLNQKLKKELEKDSSSKISLKLYEIH